LALAALIALSGCGKKKQAPVANIPPAPRAEPASPVSEPQTAVKLPPPQEVPPEAVPPLPEPHPPGERKSVSASPSARRPRPAAESGSPEPGRAEDSLMPPPESELPRLGQFLTEEQRRRYNRLIDANVAQTQEFLSRIVTSELTPDQVAAVKRIRAFLQQVEETRAQDLEIANNLAARARLLAEDLARALR